MLQVMDQAIFAHAIFNQLEGRWNGNNTQFRWDGQGWVGTDYDSCGSSPRVHCKATARSMTVSSSFSTAATSRRISICRAGCVATSIHGARATAPPSAFRVLRLISSISKSRALRAARVKTRPTRRWSRLTAKSGPSSPRARSRSSAGPLSREGAPFFATAVWRRMLEFALIVARRLGRAAREPRRVRLDVHHHHHWPSGGPGDWLILEEPAGANVVPFRRRA